MKLAKWHFPMILSVYLEANSGGQEFRELFG